MKPPHIDPSDAADEALNLYDADNDGSLNKTELVKCPGILNELTEYDADGNQSISADEITKRLTALLKYGVGLTSLKCEVRVNGKPLSNAAVLFEPEPYLGDEIKPAHGTTNGRGLAQMAIPADQLPASQQAIKAIHFGTYKVRITHPQLPSKYNTDTILGYETRAGDPFASFLLKVP